MDRGFKMANEKARVLARGACTSDGRRACVGQQTLFRINFPTPLLRSRLVPNRRSIGWLGCAEKIDGMQGMRRSETYRGIPSWQNSRIRQASQMLRSDGKLSHHKGATVATPLHSRPACSRKARPKLRLVGRWTLEQPLFRITSVETHRKAWSNTRATLQLGRLCLPDRGDLRGSDADQAELRSVRPRRGAELEIWRQATSSLDFGKRAESSRATHRRRSLLSSCAQCTGPLASVLTVPDNLGCQPADALAAVTDSNPGQPARPPLPQLVSVTSPRSMRRLASCPVSQIRSARSAAL
ncbi:hypothetical protein L1887_49102 [Cichorium endivia]|nr:hypothetical protein L1887_49102 [Cichorium endivia]